MNSKLVKRFRRELRSHPKQAAVLAGLTLVAGWFWLPLLWGGNTATPALPAKTADSVATPAAKKPAPGKTENTAAPALTGPWKQIATAIENDPNYRTIVMDLTAQPIRRFASPGQGPKQSGSSKTAGKAPPPAPMTLTGTLVGGPNRIAFLNGRGYPEGSQVQAADGGAPFVIASVDTRNVTLVRGSERLELKLRRPTGKAASPTAFDDTPVPSATTTPADEATPDATTPAETALPNPVQD